MSNKTWSSLTSTEWHVESTWPPRKQNFGRALPRRPCLHLFLCWRGLWLGPPLKMLWTPRFVTCELMWTVTWTPFKMMWTAKFVMCELMWTLPHVVIVRPVLGMANIHWDNETSSWTSRWTSTFTTTNLQCYILFGLTSYAGVDCPLWHHIGHMKILRCVDDKTYPIHWCIILDVGSRWRKWWLELLKVIIDVKLDGYKKIHVWMGRFLGHLRESGWTSHFTHGHGIDEKNAINTIVDHIHAKQKMLGIYW